MLLNQVPSCLLFLRQHPAAMEDTFSTLAPRYGSRPMLGSWSGIGTSQMSGGAINWGNLWSSVKSFGSSAKNFGSRIWNSKTAHSIRNKISNSNIRDKIAEGVATGIHGAVDLANQAIQKEIDKRLDLPPPPEVEALVEPDEKISTEGAIIKEKPLPEEVIEPPPPYAPPAKRPREELVVETVEPPSYESLYPDKAGIPMTLEEPPIIVKPVPKPRTKVPSKLVVEAARTYPMIKPATPVKVSAPVVPIASPVPLELRGWQSRLNNIVGLGGVYEHNKMGRSPYGSTLGGEGVRCVKRRRCF